MNAKPLRTTSGITLLTAALLASCAFWLIGEGRAQAASVPEASATSSDDVQDKRDHGPLDLKIFVHRHGPLVRTFDGAPQGGADADAQRVGT